MYVYIYILICIYIYILIYDTSKYMYILMFPELNRDINMVAALLRSRQFFFHFKLFV